MNRNRRKILVTIMGLLAISLFAVGTFAFFNESFFVTNVITTDKIDIALHESFDGKDLTFDGGDTAANTVNYSSNVMPDTNVKKEVKVENKGGDAYVRIKIEKVVTLADGTVKTSTPYVKTVYGNGALTAEYNTDSWEYKDGWYYSKKAMENGDIEPIISGVAFDKAMPNEYQGCKVEIKITAEATQVRGNGDSAVNAKGWPSDSLTASEGGTE